MPLERVQRENPGVLLGGRYSPPDCTPAQTVAVIIPFRHREHHLRYWLHYLHPILRRQRLRYGVYVISQVCRPRPRAGRWPPGNPGHCAWGARLPVGTRVGLGAFVVLVCHGCVAVWITGGGTCVSVCIFAKGIRACDCWRARRRVCAWLSWARAPWSSFGGPHPTVVEAEGVPAMRC